MNGISFSIAPGEVLGVVGESGAGKSLTGTAIIGLLEPPGRIAAGEIRLEGERIADVELQVLGDTGAFVETLIYPAGHWRDASSPLMHEIRKNGLDV